MTLLLLLLLLLLFNKLCIIIKRTSYKNLYKNKVVDPSKKGSCAKFEPNMISTCAKNCKKTIYRFFCNFLVFGVFDLQNDLQIQI